MAKSSRHSQKPHRRPNQPLRPQLPAPPLMPSATKRKLNRHRQPAVLTPSVTTRKPNRHQQPAVLKLSIPASRKFLRQPAVSTLLKVPTAKLPHRQRRQPRQNQQLPLLLPPRRPKAQATVLAVSDLTITKKALPIGSAFFHVCKSDDTDSEFRTNRRTVSAQQTLAAIHLRRFLSGT